MDELACISEGELQEQQEGEETSHSTQQEWLLWIKAGSVLTNLFKYVKFNNLIRLIMISLIIKFVYLC